MFSVDLNISGPVGYSPSCCKESNKTRLSTLTQMYLENWIAYNLHLKAQPELEKLKQYDNTDVNPPKLLCLQREGWAGLPAAISKIKCFLHLVFPGFGIDLTAQRLPGTVPHCPHGTWEARETDVNIPCHEWEIV